MDITNTRDSDCFPEISIYVAIYFEEHKKNTLFVDILRDGKVSLSGKRKKYNASLIREWFRDRSKFIIFDNVYRIDFGDKLFIFSEYENGKNLTLGGYLLEKNVKNRSIILNTQSKFILRSIH